MWAEKSTESQASAGSDQDVHAAHVAGQGRSREAFLLGQRRK